MKHWKVYRRSGTAEMRPVEPGETWFRLVSSGVSISREDQLNGSPKKGDMIARNPINHRDQWLVSAEYFADNFELDQ